MASADRLSPTHLGCFSSHSAGRDPSYDRDFLVGFDHIPLLDILKAFDGETAFVAGGYLTNDVLEAFQAAQFAFVYHHLISEQPH
jgi:hypothetical protein